MNWQKRCSRTFWFVVNIFFVVTITGAYSQSNAKILNIRPHPQHTLEWCWAASSAMVVEYITGQRIEDCEVLSNYDRRLGGRGMCCEGDRSCMRGAIPGEIETILGQIYGIHGSSQPNPISYNEIVSQIDDEKPIIIWLWRTPSSAHVVVIAGYRRPDTVVILDPMSGQQNVPYSVLRANWQTGVWRDTILITSDRQDLSLPQPVPQVIQQPMANFCCDQFGMRRCAIPSGPIGIICNCFGIPGSGFSCP